MEEVGVPNYWEQKPVVEEIVEEQVVEQKMVEQKQVVKNNQDIIQNKPKGEWSSKKQEERAKESIRKENKVVKEDKEEPKEILIPV